MSHDLREQIAAEAARLLLRGKEQDFAAARKRAARWLRRKRVHREEMPSNAEIQVQMYALSGVMSAERDPATLYQMRHFALELMELLADFNPQCSGAVAGGPITAGAEISIEVSAAVSDVEARLRAAGLVTRRDEVVDPTVSPHPFAILRMKRGFPAAIHIYNDAPLREGRLSAAELRELLDESAAAVASYPADEHPEAFDVFRMLLEPLTRVMLDPHTHPEGDALYHSLQVFELGRQQVPYDEEFLLACLLHDVGWAINPRHPVLSGIDALGSLITERTRFLIEQRPVAAQYLRTGECPKSLKRSEHFEDVLLLARCDRAGRVPGAQVGTLDEALDYIARLESEWDNE